MPSKPMFPFSKAFLIFHHFSLPAIHTIILQLIAILGALLKEGLSFVSNRDDSWARNFYNYLLLNVSFLHFIILHCHISYQP